MPGLSIYGDRSDIERIIGMLNADDDCAFIVSDGPKRWKAVTRLESFRDGDYCIWVRSGGSLPLLRPDGPSDELIKDPWGGWTEQPTGANPDQPYFGPGHPAVVWFDIRTKGRGGAGAIGISSFGWIGNHYRVLGSPAPEQVEKWWQRLRRAVKKSGKRIPRTGPVDGPDPDVWALPSAYRAIVNGTPRDDNPLVRPVA